MPDLGEPTGSDLAATLNRVRLVIERAVLRRLNAGAGQADVRPAGVYVRDPSAADRLAGGTLRPRGSHRSAAAALEEEIAQARALEGAGCRRWRHVATRFGLAEIAAELILVAAAFELDPDSRELIYALAGRRVRELPVEVCADILAPSPPAAVVAALGRGGPLWTSRALTIDGEGLGATISARPHLLRFLAGDDAVPAALSHLAALHLPEEELGCALPAATEAALRETGGILQAALSASRTAPVVILRGPRGAGRFAAAHALAKACGRALLVANARELLDAEAPRKVGVLADVLAAAVLLDAALLLRDIEALWGDAGAASLEHVALLRAHRGLLFVATAGAGGHVDLGRPAVVVAQSRAALEERERAWQVALGRWAAEAPEVLASAPELAGRYVIGPGAIAEVVSEARAHADAVGARVSSEGLEAAVGRRLSLRLGTFGTVVARKSRFEELVLPDDVIEPLRDMLAMVRERSLILEKWGFGRHLGISRGVSALFSGEPGTGKTMAASVLASELGLELVRIDLSAVVSKFVGETEKNLAKIFDEAQDAHAMLLFDEADSLFGKRTELRSAQDRFANLEVNYILQRMETFDGISVLTTNAENAIDAALQRRLSFRIRFPEPEPSEREQLWRRLLPPTASISGDIDFQALAERFDMTGGYIKNAVVRAAVIAARAGRDLCAEDLWAGAHSEYAEMGKVMPQLPMPGRRS